MTLSLLTIDMSLSKGSSLGDRGFLKLREQLRNTFTFKPCSRARREGLRDALSSSEQVSSISVAVQFRGFVLSLCWYPCHFLFTSEIIAKNSLTRDQPQSIEGTVCGKPRAWCWEEEEDPRVVR